MMATDRVSLPQQPHPEQPKQLASDHRLTTESQQHLQETLNENYDPSKVHILVVDDDVLTRKILNSLLKKYCFNGMHSNLFLLVLCIIVILVIYFVCWYCVCFV